MVMKKMICAAFAAAVVSVAAGASAVWASAPAAAMPSTIAESLILFISISLGLVCFA